MHDRDDDEPEVIAPTTSDEEEIRVAMESAAYRLQRLYQRLSQDRDSWAATGGNLAQATQELQKHIKSFAAIDETFRKQLAKFIREETRQAATIVAEHLKQGAKEELAKEIGSSVERLNDSVNRAGNILAAYKQAAVSIERGTLIFMILGCLIGGMLSGILVAYISRAAIQDAVIQKVTAASQDAPKARYYPQGNGAR